MFPEAVNGGKLEVVAAVTADERPGDRMNDGACDRAGRFFAGTKAEDDTPRAGNLYRMDPDRGWERLLDGVTISNGIGWSPDERGCGPAAVTT
ncbi:SMP-30/gluconolactonase/LRE family protein [Nonomuraea sp. NPDC050451]|uniref:SMP-30/gluconolactonase/LRE family protein n=1 Tax=Nonomuraea sp. NPDC050451 TaxID=3364364 RepID=UPI00378BF7E9